MDTHLDTEDSSFESVQLNEGKKFVHNAQRFFSSRRSYCHCNCSYRLIRIRNKGAMFMIIINALFASAVLVSRNKPAELQYPSIHNSVTLWVVLTFCLPFCPFIGLLSDCYFGRYKILTASLYLWLLSIVFMALDAIILSSILYCLHFVTIVLSLACFVACVIPFTIDQLVGASGEQLSFTVYWIVWAWFVYVNIPVEFGCFLPLQYQLHQTIILVLLCPSFVLAYVMNHCCDHVLMTKPQLSNPVKLIVQVLKYS